MTLLEQFVQDLRYAWRGLCRSRAYVATTVLTLSVGLGLITVLFAVFNAYVLRPFAVQDPYSLHEVAWRSQERAGGIFSWREYQEVRGRSDLFDGVIAERGRLVSSSGNGLITGFVSDNYFEVLGTRVLLGRAIAASDTRAAILSHEAWKRLFNGDTTALGREIDLNGQSAVIVGVMRPEFTGLDDTPRDVWVPLTLYGPVTGQDVFGAGQPREVGITVRLRHGVTPEHARSALTPFLAQAFAKETGVRAELPLKATTATFSLELLEMLSPIIVAFGLVLLAACTNVSNVMLARANTRYREIGVRLSVGASRGRVIRQLLTEGLLISVMAGAAGLALASVTLHTGASLFMAALPPSAAALIRVVPLDFDYRVFLFTLVAAAVTTVLFALLPAWQATRLTLTDALRGQPGGSMKGATLRDLLVASQVTVSLVLLVAAATLVRNGTALGATSLGLDKDGVISVKQRTGGEPLIGRAATVLAEDERVSELAVASRRPLSEDQRRIAVTPGQASGAFTTPYTFVSDEYFSVLRIPIVRGRGFLPEEAKAEARVAIISAAAAKAFWPNADPIGRVIRIERSDNRATDDLPDYSGVVVVGVAKDVVSGFVYEGIDAAHVYMPTSLTGPRVSVVLARGRSVHDLRADTIYPLLRKVHASPYAFESLALTELLEMQMFPLRVASSIGSLLGAIALALSLSGLYGVLTYMLSQRTREIGIRIALGATSAMVVRLIMRQSVRLAGFGMAIGLVITIGSLQVLSSMVRLQNVSFFDSMAFATGIGLVMAAAVLAAYFPARRATKLDPSRALRMDA